MNDYIKFVQSISSEVAAFRAQQMNGSLSESRRCVNNHNELRSSHLVNREEIYLHEWEAEKQARLTFVPTQPIDESTSSFLSPFISTIIYIC